MSVQTAPARTTTLLDSNEKQRLEDVGFRTCMTTLLGIRERAFRRSARLTL